MRPSDRFAIAIVAVALVGGLGALEAGVGGEIQGRVTDDRGAALARATVEVESEDTGASRSTRTRAGGLYDVKALPAGRYAIRVRRTGYRTWRLRGVRLAGGQILEIDAVLGAALGGDGSASSGGSARVESGRSSVAARVAEETLEAVPSPNREIVDLALLAPTVRGDEARGFLTLSGQRGIHSGLEIDGTDAKSAFSGSARGGGTGTRGGLPMARDAVQGLQIVVSGTTPEHGAAGSTVEVITRGGTNDLRGSVFYLTRDDGGSEDLPPSPLDRFLGRSEKIPAGEFSREHFGLSLGGPLETDRTHFFLAWDHSSREEPATVSWRRGTFDALRRRAAIDPRFTALLAGWQPNDDGLAAPDAARGRTARNVFDRRLAHRIVFGKVGRRFGDAHDGTLRVHRSDFETSSGYADEESRRRAEATAWALELVSVLGPDKVNRARVQIATDDLGRLSRRIGEAIEAEIEIEENGDSIGKLDFLPVLVEETGIELRNDFSYLLGRHDMQFGLDYRADRAEQLLASGRDGEYRFRTLQDFVDNVPSVVEIFFGDASFPNYDATQEAFAIYAQDSYRPSRGLSIDYGLRLSATRNPDGLEHLFPEGRDIPDDTDNLAPRFGFAWSPGGEGRSVVRGGAGLFFARPPAQVFASQVRENGLVPNAGRVAVEPGDIGFVPLGEPIDNRAPPPGIAVAAGFVDPQAEDAETLRAHLGYEREVAPRWVFGADLVWAEGDKLLENVDINRTVTLDEFGRPRVSPERPLTRGDVSGQADETPLGEVLTRQSIGRSEYRAVTLGLARRFSGRYELRAHYTWSEDRDTSSNEASVTDVTLSRSDDPRFDLGFSDRDIRNRLVVAGFVELPLDFTLGGVFEHRGGTPFNPVDRQADSASCGSSSLGGNCPDLRPVENGRVVGRNSYRNGSLERLDLRVGKLFRFGDRFRVDVFLEVFNVFDEAAFEVDDSPRGDRQRDPGDEQFGLASQRVLEPRQMQLGARFRF